jgi:vancomycin resistance protein VanW
VSGEPAPWRRAARTLLPLDLRLAVRRLPATLVHLARRPPGRVLSAAGLARFPHLQAERASPLLRSGAPYPARLLAGKAHNVARAASLLDGTVIGPGQTFSWHRAVGPPLRWRGFVPGPELRGEAIVAGVGGGACQVANLVLWLGLHSGLDLAERHRHDLDLFPDHERTAPFGSGCSVFFPARDLKLHNPGSLPVLLTLRVEGGWLHGAARRPVDTGVRYALVERDHRFVREGLQVLRQNRLYRVASRPGAADVELLLAENCARVCYPVPETLLSR